MFKKKENTTVIVEKKRPRKKMKPGKVVLIVIVVLLIVWFGVRSMTKGSGNMLPAVATAEVVKGDITATLDTSGTIVSEETRVYASPVNAQVGEVPVEVGQNVKKGEYLLTYDTASLQKSYDIAALQAKAEEATGNDSLAKSSESATDLATSSSDIHTLEDQINAVNAEISSLQSQAADSEKSSNTNASRQARAQELKASIEGIDAQISALEQKILEQERALRQEVLGYIHDGVLDLAALDRPVSPAVRTVFLSWVAAANLSPDGRGQTQYRPDLHIEKTGRANLPPDLRRWHADHAQLRTAI